MDGVLGVMTEALKISEFSS